MSVVSAVQGYSMNLIVRHEVGKDDRGHPIVEPKPHPVRGYFWQYGTEDSDRSGDVSLETGKCIIFADDPTIPPNGWDGVEIVQTDGESVSFEIIGKPEAKHSLARNNALHHWEVLVQRAAA